MKQITSYLATLLLMLTTTIPTMAQVGSTCDNAIFVDAEYTNTFRAGEYWFEAVTTSLPITIKCYPSVAGLQAPQIVVDFTCTYVDGVAVYDDPKVVRMVERAGEYGIFLPMTYNLRARQDENGKLYYSYTFPRDYTDMLYEHGVTYAIPAYVKLTLQCTTQVVISSGSTHARCRDQVNQFGMNTTMLFTPEDSINTYVWPLGEWNDKQYEITWEGEESDSRVLFLTSKDCDFDRFSGRVRGRYNLPAVDEAHELKITPEATADIIVDIEQPELYVHMYANKPGYLKIYTYENIDNITDFMVSGVPCVVDNEAMTITGTLPAGTDRATAIAAARYRPTSTHDGHQAEYNTPLYTKLYFGNLIYDISGIVVAQSTGNTDASLKSLSVNGTALAEFSPAVSEYIDVEVPEGQLPVISAEARKTTSSVSIQQATAVPGTAIVTVTAQAGNTLTYTVNFIKERSSDNSLSALYIDGQLIENFSATTYNYRLSVNSLPTISATLNDARATMIVDQPKQVPGFGQVIVTAENGDVQLYTINFTINEQVRECSSTVSQMNASQPYTISGGEMMRLSISEWAGTNILFTWTGNNDLGIDLLTNCLEGETTPFAQYSASASPNGTEHRCYLTISQTLPWKQHGVNGYVYVRFNTSETAQVSIMHYTPSCLTRATLINIDATVDMAANDFTKIYALYLPDWQRKDVKIKWAGGSAVELFVATDCDIDLTSTDEHLLDNGYHRLLNGGEILVTQQMAQAWQQAAGDFAYLRVLNDEQGVLTTTLVTDYGPITAIENIGQDNNATKAYKILRNGRVLIVLPDGRVLDLLGNEVR